MVLTTIILLFVEGTYERGGNHHQLLSLIAVLGYHCHHCHLGDFLLEGTDSPSQPKAMPLIVCCPAAPSNQKDQMTSLVFP